VKTVFVGKEAYWKLATLMHSQGYIPEMETLFFLTHKEIGELLKTRNGKLVSK